MMENLLLLLAASSLALAQTTETSASNTVAPGFGTSTTATGPATSSETASSSENAPVTHTVDVGLAGHTFQPDVTLANVGDIIEFNFFPTNHSVIRADYLRPCVPYEMTGRGRVGFNSDFLPVDAILEDPPKWSIRVNDTNPIFYYCGADGSCINWQMVGVINPNATTSLQKQKDAAKDSTFMLLPGQKWPDEATDPMGTGTGADSSPTETGSSSPATSTGAESSTPTSSSGGGKSLSTGAIAGIAVAGTVAVIGVAALLFFCGRASRKRNNAAAQQQPLMHQQGPFSPQAHQGHMSYVQPYHDLNKHMSVQSHQMHSPALPGYIPPQGETGPQTPGQPLYGPSDALNPGTEYAGSPAQSPNMGAVGMAPAPAYTQRNSMHPQPYSPGSQSPYQPHPSPHQYPQHGNFHEMPAAPVPDSQYQEHGQGLRPHGTPQGGSELSGSDTLGRGQTPPPGRQLPNSSSTCQHLQNDFIYRSSANSASEMMIASFMIVSARLVCFLTRCASAATDIIQDVGQQTIHLPQLHNPFDDSFDSFVEDTLRELRVPGLSIAIVDNGKIMSKGYGFAVLPNQSATADTQYFGASTTKAFTAAAAALLVHDHDQNPGIEWTTPINHLIRSDFVLQDEYATSHITIEDALSHRTGMPRHDLVLGQSGDTPSTVARKIRHLPPTAQPRARWQYCNMMYGVMTDLIQTVTGANLERVLREKIWDPLGMLSTTFTIPTGEHERARLARGYYWHSHEDDPLNDTTHGEYVPDVYLNLLSTAGDGAIISTVNDYALWIKALMDAAGHPKSSNSSSPITPSVYRDLVTPRAIIPQGEWQDSEHLHNPPLYALGWLTAQVSNAQIVLHDGGITGFGAEVYMLPGQNYGVVTMGNTAGSSNEAGAIIASSLIARKLHLAKTTGHSPAASSIHRTLLRIQKAGLHRLRLRSPHPRNDSAPKREQCPLAHHKPHHHLPISVDSLAGMYSHPAYGTLNLTVPAPKRTTGAAADHTASMLSKEVLETLFYRECIYKQVFTQFSGTVFKTQFYEPHGLGDVVTGEGIVWEEIDLGDEDTYAVFEFGIDGESVERVGIELDGEMVVLARAGMDWGRGKGWREGMIWFERDS